MRALSTLVALSSLCLACGDRDNPAFSGGEVINLERGLYPEGPYGWAEGDVMPNWVFLDQEGDATSMQEIRARTYAKTLVLLPSAEWMDAARSMLPRAEALHAEGREEILLISAVFEDNRAEPAEPGDATAWQSEHAIEWPVIAEPEGQFRLAWRDDMRAAVMINLDSMKRLSASARPAISEVLWP